MGSSEEILKFDQYIQKEMDADERAAFEKELQDSPILMDRFNEYRDFSIEIEAGVEYARITGNLSEIHAEIYPEKKIFKLNPKLLISIGIAATITLLILVVPFKQLVTSEENSYAPLSNYSDEERVGTVKSSELDTSNNNYQNGDGTFENDSLKDNLPFFTGTPHGTAFLISNQGYFLTSKHLVEQQAKTYLQQEDLNLCFEVRVVYIDSLLDFAILKASKNRSQIFDKVPYELNGSFPDLGEDVFTLGYPKREIVFTKGVVSSEMGYNSDSIYFEISLPTNAGHSGAPLFNSKGNLIGIITAKNISQQVVTYALKPSYIENKLIEIQDSIKIDINKNQIIKQLKLSERIKEYRPFIFELY